MWFSTIKLNVTFVELFSLGIHLTSVIAIDVSFWSILAQPFEKQIKKLTGKTKAITFKNAFNHNTAPFSNQHLCLIYLDYIFII